MTIGVASLGIYDHGSQHEANDRLWAAIADMLRARGIKGVPDSLDRGRPLEENWVDPLFLFGHICGLPLVSRYPRSLRVIGRPVYDAPGCENGFHASFIIARHDDATTIHAYRGRRAAINERGSNTGTNLFRATIAGVAGAGRFFDTVTATGSHRESMIAVASKEADIAAIDAVTYAAILRAEPELVRSLRILTKTVDAPTPPFVTSRSTPIDVVAALQIAFSQITIDPALADVREKLFLSGIEAASISDYAPLLALESNASAVGYPQLI